MMLTNVKHASVKRLTKNPWLSVLLALLLIASFTPLLAQSPSATAQETCTGGSWSNIKWKDDSPNIKDGKYVGPSGFAEVQFDWKASSTAKAGDTIKLKLPKELKAVNTGTVTLQNKNGEIVATGSWSGDEFIITLTDFQDRNFDVEGSAFVSVAWNTSSNFDGSLNFNGCGSGNLPGKFEQREGGLFHDDSKIGEYTGYDEKTGNYKIQWSVGIDPKKHQSDNHRVIVTDKAPEGWKFTCDGNDANGYYPAYVSSIIKNGYGQAEIVRHAIYDVTDYPSGGTLTGFSNIKSENPQSGSNYKLNCTPDEVSVEFPRGLSTQSAPILTLTAVTKNKPAPGSIVTNKAKIDGVEVEGHVRFPNAGGLGRGSKGGFTIEKNVVGTEEDKAKDYTFEYQCTSANGGSEKKGTVTVKHGNFAHVKDLDKGLTCKIKEQDLQVEEGRKLTTSWVVIDKDGKATSSNSTSTVDITIEDPSEEAVHLVVTNKFEQKQTGSFTLKKKVEGVETSEKFTFKWECTANEGTKVSGESTLAHDEEVKIENLPLKSTCKITETPVELEGYTHSLSWLTNDEDSGSDNPFTVTPRDSSTKTPLVVTAVNKYTPVVPPVDPTSSSSTTTPTTEPTSSSSTTTPTTEPTSSSSTTTPTTEPTSSSSTTTPTTEPTSSSSTTTPTTEPTSSSSTTTPTTEPTSSSSTTTPTTEPTSSSSTTTKTTHAIPPIIPIPIPIPVPTVLPPAPTVSPNVPTPTATPQAQPSSTAPQPERGKGVLARTGASVLWIALLAVLLVGLGGVMMYITNAKKKK